MLEGLRARLQKDKWVPLAKTKSCVLGGLLLAGAAPGQTISAAPWDGTIPRPSFFIGNTQLELGGMAAGALFRADPHAAQDASGVVKLMPRLHRDFDSGL